MRVDQLWRYPVKSVGGEPLTAATVGVRGVEGDRVVAVHDERDEVTWAGAVPALMQVRAVAAGADAAELILSSGQRFRSDAPDADDRLSAAVHAKVKLIGHRPDTPDAAVHVLTTTALHSLGLALPDSAVDATRFRPIWSWTGYLTTAGAGTPSRSGSAAEWPSVRCGCASPRSATGA